MRFFGTFFVTMAMAHFLPPSSPHSSVVSRPFGTFLPPTECSRHPLTHPVPPDTPKRPHRCPLSLVGHQSIFAFQHCLLHYCASPRWIFASRPSSSSPGPSLSDAGSYARIGSRTRALLRFYCVEFLPFLVDFVLLCFVHMSPPASSFFVIKVSLGSPPP